MRAVLPGRPAASLQALCSGDWDGLRIIVYVSGNALVIINGAQELLQTIYINDALELNAVTIEESSGKIAAVGGSHIYIYEPRGKDEGVLHWAQSHDLESEADPNQLTSVSWGSPDEIVVGGSYLTLWSIQSHDAANITWKQRVAYPTKLATFSHDAGLIASIGSYDRIVKIWRRLSYDQEDVRFDTSYLAHPATVANTHWRKPWHKDQNMEYLLYTFCADSKIRIWAATDPHGLSTLQLWHTIDMNEVLQPRHLGLTTSRKYAFIVDSRDFAIATEKAIEKSMGDATGDHALQHLIEIANRIPEICVVLDGQGHMSAWGLENAGSKSKTPSSVFNIAHVEGLNVKFDARVSNGEDFAIFKAFNGGVSPDSLTILVHHFDGHIDWYDSRITKFIDTSSKQRQRVSERALWSGHDSAIKKIVRNVSGSAILSRTDENHGVVWRQVPGVHGPGLVRQSTLLSDEHIHRSSILLDGSLTALLHHDGISLWDTQGFYAQRLERRHYTFSSKPLCLLALPTVETSSQKHYLAALGADAKGIVWEVLHPSTSSSSGAAENEGSPLIREFCPIDLKLDEDVAYVLPVDPAGSKATISGFVDLFALDVALAYSSSGTVRMLTAKVDKESHVVEWLVTCTVRTGIANPSLASGSLIRKVALVDASKTTLTIWDTTGAQLEYQERFSEVEIIQDLDWTSTPDNQSVLAVGFPHRVLLLSQLRYDYLNAGRAWTIVREIRIKDSTPHPIGDSCWLGSGNLVIGAGNQMFVYDQQMEVNDLVIEHLRLPARRNASKQLFEVVRRLNGPLPVFHPQFLAQCIVCGKSSLVQKILATLHRKLKFWTEGDDMDTFLDLPIDLFTEEETTESVSKFQKMLSFNGGIDDDDDALSLTEESAAMLNDHLAKKTIDQLTSQEQFLLADLVECVATVEKQKRSMDDNAARYLVFFRQQTLKGNQAGTSTAQVSWREIVWAFHSGSQDIIVDMISRHWSGKLTWERARQTGMFMFLSDVAAVRANLETVARTEYTKNDDRSPTDCSLYYLALRKKAVLSGLWRMAQGFKEQAATMKLLANNFSEPRWKTAALKNAYALLSKRRFHYAAAFFLLGDSLLDAVDVCIDQLQDLQLAVAIARAYEGDDGPVLQKLLRDKVLPEANVTGNRWLASWAFWMLNRRDKAVRSLITPIQSLIDLAPSSSTSPAQIPLKARTYLSDDPALVVLYQQLRQKSLQTLKGATMINPREEWDFVVRNARLYTRMGCDVLALDLVKNFEFLKVTTPSAPRKTYENGLEADSANSETPDPRLLLRRRGSLVVADLPSPLTATATHSDGLLKGYMADDRAKAPKAPKPKAPPTVFEEPSADSLLDSFGF